MRQIKGLEKKPVYDDFGRLLALDGQDLPRPADNTDQALSRAIAAQALFKRPLQAQTNHMDEAYNHMLLQKPSKPLIYSDERKAQQQRNEALKQILINYFGGFTRQ